MPACRTRRYPAWRACAVLIIATSTALLSVGAGAQGMGLLKGNDSDKPPAALAVPDPAALKAGWWDYVAADKPGIEGRVSALLAQAGASAGGLPTENAIEAGQAIERLRISLSTLPGMLAAQPAAVPEAAPAQEAYTTTEILKLDRNLRDLQDDRDERRSAINVAERAIRNGERRADTAFAAYLARKGTAGQRTLDGLQIMATRAEVAVMQAEAALRQREITLLDDSIRALTAQRDGGRGRITGDSERPPQEIQALIEKNRTRLDAQRAVILRERALRSELATRMDASKEELSLADLRMLTAMIEESVLATRIALYETELDWLAIAAAQDSTIDVAEIDRRLEQRRADLRLVEEDIADWVVEIERLIAASLRTRSGTDASTEAAAGNALLDLGRKTISRLNRLRSLQADVRFAITVAGDLLAESAGWRGWWHTRVVKPGITVTTQADGLLGSSLFNVGGAPVTAYGLLRVLLIMAAAIALSRLLRHLVTRFGARQKGSASAGLYTISRLLHYVLITAGLMIGLASIGLDMSRLALVAGALSIGIGFGLQSVVNNFVSGLMILFEQSLKIGDVVELDSGVRGVVREIRVRSTLITTSDAVDVIVPNSEFVAGKVTNYTHDEPFHRIHVPFGVAYHSDKDKVRAVVIEAARAVACTHLRPGREPDVWLVRFGDNSLDFELVVWINPAAAPRPGAIMATYLWEIESALRANGIEIPFPQRDVRLKLESGDSAALGAATGRRSS